MEGKLWIFVTAVGLGISAIVISGCAEEYRTDLVKSGVLSLEKHSMGQVYIAWTNAYEDGDDFVITGALGRRGRVGGAIKVHVDITILSPDGTILGEARSTDVYVSRRITGSRYLKIERFEVRFPSIPPQGSSVHVISHSGRHDDTIKS
jgi:hypothetical protein